MLGSLQEALRFSLRLVRLVLMTAWIVSMLLMSRVSQSVRAGLAARIIDVMKDTPLRPEDYVDTMFSMAFVRRFFYGRYTELWVRARKGEKAPDPVVHDLSALPLNLLSFMRTGRPLVLNFGSCS